MEDTQSAELNEKLTFRFFRFLVFDYGWLYLQFTVTHQMCHRPKKKVFKSGKIHKKDAQWVETIEKSIFKFFRFLIFDMIDFVLRLIYVSIFIMLSGLRPPNPPFLWRVALPTFLCPWTLHDLGLRTLASLVSVWIRKNIFPIKEKIVQK